jgi:hypothetical protein
MRKEWPELPSAAESLGKGLHPATAATLADQVRIMNTCYSNPIEGITRMMPQSAGEGARNLEGSETRRTWAQIPGKAR